MHLQFHKYQRKELSIEQRRFLEALWPYALLLQKWVYAKAQSRHVDTPLGIRPSVFMSDVILLTDWGKHPASQPKYGNRKPANNLSLLKANTVWLEGKKIFEHEGITYRSYANWEECIEDLSDYYGWLGFIDQVLVYPDTRRQVQAFITIRNAGHAEKMLDLIHKYGLDEHDLSWQKI